MDTLHMAGFDLCRARVDNTAEPAKRGVSVMTVDLMDPPCVEWSSYSGCLIWPPSGVDLVLVLTENNAMFRLKGVLTCRHCGA